MRFQPNSVLDPGLTYLQNETNALWLLAVGEEDTPTTYSAALALRVGRRAAPTMSAPEDIAPFGRRVTAAAFVDGVGTATGTATHWAWVHEQVTDEGNELLVVHPMAAPAPITDAAPFPLALTAYRNAGMNPVVS
jgi:hypothetical protein